MSVKTLFKCDEEGLRNAAEKLLSGSVGVIPTDTVYGLAACPSLPEAVERLYSIKDRAKSKPIAILADSVESARRYIGEEAARFGGCYWPGALTVVANSEAVRIPNCLWTKRLISSCGGALRVTSANISGSNPALDAAHALEEIGLRCDFVFDNGISPGGMPSTVVKFIGGGVVEVLRPGPIEFFSLRSASPRRAKILSDLGLFFTLSKSDAPEVSYSDDPERTVRENALIKGGGEKNTLSADTIVHFNGKIYGKPRDIIQAKRFLSELSGNVHSVYTAVQWQGDVKVVRSDVKFRNLTISEIDEYIAKVMPLDRAGAYDIDESGSLIVESYTGSYENIMGLPVEPILEWGIKERFGRKQDDA